MTKLEILERALVRQRQELGACAPGSPRATACERRIRRTEAAIARIAWVRDRSKPDTGAESLS